MNAEERKVDAENKKKQLLKTNKDKKKKSETLDARMGAIIKPTKEKTNERVTRMREDLSNYIKNVLLEGIITAAQCYGESLLVGRSIQENFENRPVSKFVFPMIQEF